MAYSVHRPVCPLTLITHLSHIDYLLAESSLVLFSLLVCCFNPSLQGGLSKKADTHKQHRHWHTSLVSLLKTLLSSLRSTKLRRSLRAEISSLYGSNLRAWERRVLLPSDALFLHSLCSSSSGLAQTPSITSVRKSSPALVSLEPHQHCLLLESTAL